MRIKLSPREAEELVRVLARRMKTSVPSVRLSNRMTSRFGHYHIKKREIALSSKAKLALSLYAVTHEFAHHAHIEPLVKVLKADGMGEDYLTDWEPHGPEYQKINERCKKIAMD